MGTWRRQYGGTSSVIDAGGGGGGGYDDWGSYDCGGGYGGGDGGGDPYDGGGYGGGGEGDGYPSNGPAPFDPNTGEGISPKAPEVIIVGQRPDRPVEEPPANIDWTFNPPVSDMGQHIPGVIGDEGFESLLFRSVHRVTLDYPWLEFDPRARPSEPGFALLRRCFESQDIVQAGLASNLLFNTLIDILTLLIGDHLTTLILQSALGRVGGGKISKEHHNG